MSWNRFYAGLYHKARSKESRRVHLMVRHAVDEPDEPFASPVTITVTAYMKDNRAVRDPDNIPAKLYIDGLVKSGVLVDDDWRYVDSVTTKRRLDRERPRVEIEIHPTPIGE